MACTAANGSYTCSLICDLTYLGIALSDAVSLPVFFSFQMKINFINNIPKLIAVKFHEIRVTEKAAFLHLYEWFFLGSLSVRDVMCEKVPN